MSEIPQEAVTSVAIQTGTTARTVRAVVSAAVVVWLVDQVAELAECLVERDRLRDGLQKIVSDYDDETWLQEKGNEQR
jgi:hypothetical protein